MERFYYSPAAGRRCRVPGEWPRRAADAHVSGDAVALRRHEVAAEGLQARIEPACCLHARPAD